MPKRDSSSKRTDRLTLKARVVSRDQARGLVARAGDAAVIVRGRPRSMVMSCPCGCGDQLTINLDSRSGPAWRFVERRGKVTLYPSVWRESGCKSHFVVWQNQIYLFGQDDFDRRRHPKLEDRVYKQLADGRAQHFADIADGLNELPWSVLVACENLASDGKVRELERPNHGKFIREDTN
jgi:hypothetical protein